MRAQRQIHRALRAAFTIVVLVPEDAIHRAQLALWEALRVVAEPGGAAAFATLIPGRYEPRPGEHVGILLSGGNIAAVNFG
jgi:threonine dehydratase